MFVVWWLGTLTGICLVLSMMDNPPFRR